MMRISIRSLFLSGGVALALSGSAFAQDFLVLSSSDAGVKKGATFAAGQLVQAAPGTSVTVMSPAGEIVRLTAAADGVRMPAAAAGGRKGAVDSLQKILLRPPPSRRTFGAMRGGEPDCPAVESLTTVEAIVAADEKPECRRIAATALQALVDSAPAAQ